MISYEYDIFIIEGDYSISTTAALKSSKCSAVVVMLSGGDMLYIYAIGRGHAFLYII